MTTRFYPTGRHLLLLLRSVLALKPPDLKFLLLLASQPPLGFPSVYVREAFYRFLNGSQEIEKNGRVRLQSQPVKKDGWQVSALNPTLDP